MNCRTYHKSVLSLFLAAAPCLCHADTMPDDVALQTLLRERVDQSHQTPAIVVGWVDETGTRIIHWGRLDRAGNREVDGDTVFEIGSATKVFTALLLAQEVEQGKVSLDDPVSKYLPPSVKVPARNGRQITLLDLATHTSALPRLPGNLAPKDAANPYADYTVEQLYAFLSGYTLPRDIGAEYEYSNLGVGLLGHILALEAGTNYEALVLQRICRPLGMTNTQITLSPDLKARLATGHNAAGDPVANWDFPTLAGAGALRSTANDLLKFVAANLGLVKSDLRPAMQLSQKSRHSAGSPDMDIGLCWHIAKKFGTDLVWHNGGTGGYRSFIGFDPQKRRGVIVLANSANSVDDLGFHLLEPKYPLARFQPPKSHTAIRLEATALDRYAGRYEFAPGLYFNLRRDGVRLLAQLTGQPYNEIFPESETEFFYKIVDAQITFVKDSQGHVTALILHQNGQNPRAEKIP